MSNFGGWHLTTEPDERGEYHVYPLNDDRPHECSCDCPCAPERDEDPEHVESYSKGALDGDATLWMHNSFDGREDFEDGARLPS